MTPTERARTTRRRRLAHLGIGGVLAAVAGSQAGALIAGSDSKPTAAEATTAPVVSDVPPKIHLRPTPKPASRAVPVPRPVPHVVRPASTGGIPAVWRALVRCEAGRFGWRYGAPDVGTDPGYDFEGGPNFTNGTWLAYGGGRYARHAYDATPIEQIRIAERVLLGQGVGAWPECGPRVHLTRADGTAPLG